VRTPLRAANIGTHENPEHLRLSAAGSGVCALSWHSYLKTIDTPIRCGAELVKILLAVVWKYALSEMWLSGR